MLNHFPGTTVLKSGRSAYDFLYGIFSATKGLMLSQVREITGLETSAIQNWVSRGWLQKPVEKKYDIEHLSRILIFNMLRDVMKFENIVALMEYINGKTDDISDDIISESRLYIYICDIISHTSISTIYDGAQLHKVIVDTVSDYTETSQGAKEKLILGLEIIITYYAAALIRSDAQKKFSALFSGGAGRYPLTADIRLGKEVL